MQNCLRYAFREGKREACGQVTRTADRVAERVEGFHCSGSAPEIQVALVDHVQRHRHLAPRKDAVQDDA